MLTSAILRSRVDALWDKFWSRGISNPLSAIDQMSYLIFLKRLEDMDNARVATAKRRGKPFKSVFDGKMESAGKKIDKTKCRWSYWSQFPDEEMIRHVRDVEFDLYEALFSNFGMNAMEKLSTTDDVKEIIELTKRLVA